MSHMIFKKQIGIPPSGEDDRRAYEQRIKDALGLDFLEIPLSFLVKFPSYVSSDRDFPLILGNRKSGPKIIDILREHSFSLVLDLGTTNLVAKLYDNISQREVVRMNYENPHIIYGTDILTRMQHAMSHSVSEMHRQFIFGINEFIQKICADTGIEKNDIHGMVVAGNTVMTHFFLGLDISTIPVEPFEPVIKNPGFLTSSELGLGINPEAVVYVFPNAGSYVGGDVISGILSSGIYTSEEPSVLIDVGTNAEVVIGNREWLLVGAGAAGPALEDGISIIGRRAQNGIIYDITMRSDDAECLTFDNGLPEGICGSGMVSLIYEMYTSGIIDEKGMLNASRKGVSALSGENIFWIPCKGKEKLFIKQTEIDNFLKSKAAMFTLLFVLLRSVGLKFCDIKSVYIAGALGNAINAKKAIGIGLLPAWSPDIIVPLGNTSLKGAELVLQNNKLIDIIDSIIERTTYKHMHDDPVFMKEFMGATFIPHTNPEILKI